MATAWIVFDSESDVRATVEPTSFGNENAKRLGLSSSLNIETNQEPCCNQRTNNDEILSSSFSSVVHEPLVAESLTRLQHEAECVNFIGHVDKVQVPSSLDDVKHTTTYLNRDLHASLLQRTVDHDKATSPVAKVTSTYYVPYGSGSGDHSTNVLYTSTVADSLIDIMYNPQLIDNVADSSVQTPLEIKSEVRYFSLPTSPLSARDKDWSEHTNDLSSDKLFVNNKCFCSCENIEAGTLVSHAKLCKTVSDGAALAPPIPPRDYVPRTNDHVEPRRIEIHPVVQDGQKLSSTHYWLLPDKQRITLPDSSNKAPEFYINMQRPTRPLQPVAVNVSDVSHGCRGPADIRTEPSTARSARDFHHGTWTESTLHLLADEADMDTVSVDLPHVGTIVEKVAKEPLSSYNTANCHTETAHDLSTTTSMSQVRDMIDRVQVEIGGVTYDESYTALATNHWNFDEACKYLKVEHLFCLAVANRSICRSMLERNNWNIELAASAMLDLTRTAHSQPSGKSPLRSPRRVEASQRADTKQQDIRTNHDLLTTPHTSTTTSTTKGAKVTGPLRKQSLSPRTCPVTETKDTFLFEPAESRRTTNS